MRNLVVAEHFVESSFLHVDHFTLHRKDGLIFTFAALLGRTTGGVTLNNKQFGAGRVAAGAVGELAGQAAAFERAFAAGEVARLAGRTAGAGCNHRFFDDQPGRGRGFFEVGPELFVDDLLNNPFHFAGTKLGFGLPFKLRVGNFNADDGGDAFADVVAAHGLLFVFDQLVRFRVGIHGSGECGAEAGEMGSAFDRVDVVGEGEDGFVVGVGVLHCNFHHDIVLFTFEIDDVRMHRRFVFVQMLNELQDSAVVFKDLFAAGRIFGEGDFCAAIEEGELAEAGGEDIPLETFIMCKNSHIRDERLPWCRFRWCSRWSRAR